ncbi:hypothetical protein HK100_011906 [Physocladia obscura]|uniref:SAM domain-containing protein n=1 Tax=Physocladia obscura TaxID=109957 RepID=A0AAD5T160_9FUNG|nr:hypothetical protein HK100_011906 [Physocladia obscura]
MGTLYTGTFAPIGGSSAGGYIGGCVYEGEVLNQFGPKDPVEKCGGHCQNTTGCGYFTFIADVTGGAGVGPCFIYSATNASGPFVANATDLCGYVGSDSIAPNSRPMTTASANSSLPTQSNSLSSGAIAGIVCAILIVAVLGVLFAVFWFRRHRRQKPTTPNPETLVPHSTTASPPNRETSPATSTYASAATSTAYESVAVSNNFTPQNSVTHYEKLNIFANIDSFNTLLPKNEKALSSETTPFVAATSPSAWSVAETLSWLHSIGQSQTTITLFQKYHCDGRFLKAISGDRDACNRFLRDDLGLTNVRERAILVNEILTIMDEKGGVGLSYPPAYQ